MRCQGGITSAAFDRELLRLEYAHRTAVSQKCLMANATPDVERIGREIVIWHAPYQAVVQAGRMDNPHHIGRHLVTLADLTDYGYVEKCDNGRRIFPGCLPGARKCAQELLGVARRLLS